MNHFLNFIQEYQSVIMIILINAFFFYIQSVAKSIKRSIDLMRIKQEASIYASQKVNGEFKHYSEEWHRHYNERLEYLIKEYRFTIT